MDSYARRLAFVAFNYGPATVRRFVVRRLAMHRRDLAEVILPLAVRDASLEVRLAALEVVSAWRQWEDLRLLSMTLHDPHPAVRATAAQALGQTRSALVGNDLQAALRDRHPEVRAMAAWGLGQIPTTKFSQTLESMLRDQDPQVRAAAAEALGRVGRAEALIALRAIAARDPIYHVRAMSTQAVKELERRTAPPEEKKRLARLELIQTLLDNRRPLDERLHAKQCLIRIKGEMMIPMLEQALDDTNDTQVHLHIVEILASLSPCKSLQDALTGCLHHISTPVRHRAIMALESIGDRQAIYYLDELAREADKPGQLWTLEDARLAREAIQKIDERTRRQIEERRL